MPALSDLIRGYRHNAGLTQQALAAESGLSAAAIRDLEQGRRSRPWRRSIAALCEALGLGPEDAQELEQCVQRGRRSEASTAGSGPSKPLWIAVLGPVAVLVHGESVPVGSQVQQAILGLLAIQCGAPVQPEAILELSRGEQPVPVARNYVQSRVSRLRLMLRTGKFDGDARQTIASVVGGYMLQVGPTELDLLVFSEFAMRAEAAYRTHDVETACLLYERAFELCRGEPCANVSLLAGHPAVTRLRREVADAILRYAEASSELGRHDLVLRRLESLAVSEPLDERVHARLMIALAGSGQQAQALRVYEELRTRLQRELGIYPSAELSAAHLSVLRQTVSSAHLSSTRTHDVTHAAHDRVLQQLPTAHRYLYGREAELADLTSLLDQHRRDHSQMVVAVTGMGGIGKTALALYWAGQVAQRFPDGQLYADLRGFAPSGSPASPTEVLRRFLSAFGLPDVEIPLDLDRQLALFRSAVATKRVLIVLDNARNAEQVRSVLPGTPGCFVLVTSRNRLTGLLASHGGPRLPLDCLSEEQSRLLLNDRLCGEQLANGDRGLGDIAVLCAGLPLALCNAVARAEGQTRMPLGELTAAMPDEFGRLDALETGDETTSLRAVFSWSQATRNRRAAQMLRFLSMHPGPSVTLAAAASLAGVPLRDAYLTVTELSDEYLITEERPGRYTSHELVRAYAAETAQKQEAKEDRRAAKHRMLDHYLQTLAVAWHRLAPSREKLLLPPPLPGVVRAELPSAVEATAWLRSERHALPVMIQLAAEEGFSPHAWELPLAASLF
jgi:DNA-binding SARP family transcriptional activator/transcriptional regulator with XRE-family HTH domain